MHFAVFYNDNLNMFVTPIICNEDSPCLQGKSAYYLNCLSVTMNGCEHKGYLIVFDRISVVNFLPIISPNEIFTKL